MVQAVDSRSPETQALKSRNRQFNKRSLNIKGLRAFIVVLGASHNSRKNVLLHCWFTKVGSRVANFVS